MRLRVMTYNVHSCIDTQKKNSSHKIAEFISKERPTVVGLNEVATFTPRIRFANQPKHLAALRNMFYYYGPTLKMGPIGFFGNAILSFYPVYDTENFPLPSLREQRCCVRARISIPGGHVTVFSTHLGLNRDERIKQIDEISRLVKREKNPVILMGDFNCGIDQLAPLYEFLTDTGAKFGSKLTYPFDNPVDRLDYILISKEFNCKELDVPLCDASDHLPVIADIELH